MLIPCKIDFRTVQFMYTRYPLLFKSILAASIFIAGLLWIVNAFSQAAFHQHCQTAKVVNATINSEPLFKSREVYFQLQVYWVIADSAVYYFQSILKRSHFTLLYTNLTPLVLFNESR